jgi:hypothetical protein
MKDRIALIRHDPLIRVMMYSLVLGLGCSAGGCGGEPSTNTASEEVPAGVKNMKESMKNQAAMQKGAMGKQQRPGPPVK